MLTEIDKRYILLENEFNWAIMHAVQTTIDKCKRLGTTPQEPDFIASLTLQLPNAQFKTLRKYFPANEFSVTGVFCTRNLS
jgi:hypothetical protein